MRRPPEPPSRHERGASLVIVLAFMLLVGVVAVVLLGLGFTGTASTRAFRVERVIRTNAESALNVTVSRLTKNPTMATDATSSGTPALDPGCNLDFPMDAGPTAGAPVAFTAGSYLQVTCGPTSALASGGAWGGLGSGGTDTDGGQRPRDVTITVVCQGPPTASSSEPATCGGSGTARVVATARVRFEIDPGASDPTQRAVVPKVITWET